MTEQDREVEAPQYSAATPRYAPGTGQTVLDVPGLLDPHEQARVISQFSDPSLSELGLDELLEELLIRVRQALAVDTAAILLLDENTDELVARAAKGLEEEVEQQVRIPVGRGFAGRIAAERVPIFISDVEQADVVNPILRQAGVKSLLGLPLIVEGGLVGVMHVGSLTRRIFDRHELAALQIVAARVAPGIERARLYSALEHEHRVAVVLQRSLLPRRLLQTPSVAAKACYAAAVEEVGGDWYDVFELPDNRVGVTIGDVVGHGVHAAALMGQLRTAVHAYAVEDHGPARTLQLVNAFLGSMPNQPMATAAYAVLDPTAGLVRIASAGHPQPVIVRDGKAAVAEVQPGAPLGAFPDHDCQELALSLGPSESLVLYTDGLIERRGVAMEESVRLLLETLSGSETVEDICRVAFDELVPPEGLSDDAAMVVVQRTA